MGVWGMGSGWGQRGPLGLEMQAEVGRNGKALSEGASEVSALASVTSVFS